LPDTALLDASVLHPMVLCDLLIRLAQRGLYRALWSREILEEVVRSVARRRPDLSIAVLRKRTAAMQEALQDATVEGYEGLIPTLRDLGDDAHVAAAAVFGRADVIVTSNVRDFPARLLDQYRIAVRSPDSFLTYHWWLDAVAVVEVLMRQSKGTSRPPLSPDDILVRLGILAPDFVHLVRGSGEYRTAMRSRS
jgi:predicted nucleic acid-binding protein